jgi:flagellar motor switch protein FliN
MADGTEKRLITAFCDAWGESAPTVLGKDTTLSLLSLRELSGDGLTAALAVAATWSSGFIANCSSGLPGAVICLFKSEDGDVVERLAKSNSDGQPKPGGRSVVIAALNGAATRFTDTGQELSFSGVTHLDLSNQESRLATIVGDTAWVGTFSLSISSELDTQALMLYAPRGAFQSPGEAANASASAAAPPAESQAKAAAGPAAQSAASRRTARREEPAARNIERLMGVELEIIVRFGATSMLLRDIVRLGTGMMIELNRAVDEPVELLVNGRPLARGEVVVIDGYYGVRITEIGAPSERLPLS